MRLRPEETFAFRQRFSVIFIFFFQKSSRILTDTVSND